MCPWGGDGVEDMEGESLAMSLSANEMGSPSTINGLTEVDRILFRSLVLRPPEGLAGLIFPSPNLGSRWMGQVADENPPNPSPKKH